MNNKRRIYYIITYWFLLYFPLENYKKILLNILFNPTKNYNIDINYLKFFANSNSTSYDSY